MLGNMNYIGILKTVKVPNTKKAVAVTRFPKAIIMKGHARSGIVCSQGWRGWTSTSSDITEIVFSSSDVVRERFEEVRLIMDRLSAWGERRPRSWQIVLLVVAGGRKGWTRREPEENRLWDSFMQNPPSVKPKATAAWSDWMKGADLSGPSM